MIDQDYIDKLRARIQQIESDLSRKEVATDQNQLRDLTREHTHLKKMDHTAGTFLQLRRHLADNELLLQDSGGDDELRELAHAEKADLEQALAAAEKELRVALLPPNPDDSRNIIMEIRAGTGGDEAALFAGDLYRLYSRYAEQRGWTTQLIDANHTDLGGYKEIVFSMEGKDVFKWMQYESGGHRVQRIPVTESGGRIHTSAATVAVLPEAGELDDIRVRSEDLRIDTFRASGAGGQHVNRTDSAVRITHLPTGLVVQSQDERSQHRNKDKCMRVLKARLLDLQRQEEAARVADSRRSQVGSGDRSQRIRTYNFPQNRVTDHRINLTLYSLDRMMEGNMDDLVNALYERDLDLRLQQQLESTSPAP